MLVKAAYGPSRCPRQFSGRRGHSGGPARRCAMVRGSEASMAHTTKSSDNTTAPALRGALDNTAPALRGGALDNTAPALRGGALRVAGAGEQSISPAAPLAESFPNSEKVTQGELAVPVRR